MNKLKKSTKDLGFIGQTRVQVSFGNFRKVQGFFGRFLNVKLFNNKMVGKVKARLAALDHD